MPRILEGVYIYDEDMKYEVETNYHLNYHVSSALFSISKIKEPLEVKTTSDLSNIHYYRYYLEHLFYSMGQINDRFVFKYSKYLTEEENKAKKECVDRNKREYRYEESTYKIINIKDPRNIIEHIDEKNLKNLQNNYVGGFNVIFKDSAESFVKSLRENRKYYPFILDLTLDAVLFYDCSNEVEYSVNIGDLYLELVSLKKEILDIKGLLESKLF